MSAREILDITNLNDNRPRRNGRGSGENGAPFDVLNMDVTVRGRGRGRGSGRGSVRGSRQDEGRGSGRGRGVSRANLTTPGPSRRNFVEDQLLQSQRHRTPSPLSPRRYRYRSRSPQVNEAISARVQNLENMQQSMLNIIMQQQQTILQQQNQVLHRNRRRHTRNEHRERTQSKQLTFRKVVDLNHYFSSTPKYQMLYDDLQRDRLNHPQLKNLRREASTACMELLKKDLDGDINLKKRKKQILTNIAKSLIQTFPVLSTEIMEGENPNWAFVS